MKKNTIVYRSNRLIPVTFTKMPEEMTYDELVTELVQRMKNEKTSPFNFAEHGTLLHEIETHQLELEIQNRELVEKYQDIEELNKKYVGLYDHAPVGYFSLDLKGTISELNLTAAMMMKLEKKKIIGKSLAKWILQEDLPKLHAHLSDSCQSEEKIVCELEVVNNDGEHLLVELHSNCVTDKETLKSSIKTAMIDVSERKKLKEAVEDSKFLREERELREKFIAAFSHDIRTPLTSSKLCAQMLNGAISDIEKKKKLYELMVQELDRADRMIRELLDASKMSVGESFPTVFKKCDLRLVAQKCIGNMHALNSGKFQINLREFGDLTGLWSSEGLHRVLENLLSNAAKYGAPDLPITVSLEDQGQNVLVIVHNHGDPIPPKEQHRIFDAFHRTVSARSSDSTGWGLGLSLVNSIVKRHGGSIVVRSLLDEGTSFMISLPKKPISNPRG